MSEIFMSLMKQLWTGIIVMLLLAMGGSFGISLLSAQHYLDEQLHLKNLDNAQSIALSLTQMEKDLINLELLISTQFDTGHYEYIVLTDPQNKILVARQYDGAKDKVESQDIPEWFTQLVNFDPSPGIAQVQDGWQQFGTLKVKSHSRYAAQALWSSTTQLCEWFFIAAVLSGALGTVFLKFISNPLNLVIKQAEAISERRFITSDEPKTIEFQRLVRAMNALSYSVKIMLDKETSQLEKLRKASHLDELTQLPNRHHFLNLLESFLKREDSSSGVIAIARVLNLAELNNQLGHAATDHALVQIAGVLHQVIERYPGSYAGRLNGSDFIIVISSNPSADSVGSELIAQFDSQLQIHNLSTLQLPIAACTFTTGTEPNEILHKLDGALAQAELKGNRALITLSNNYHPLAHRNLNGWREAITVALAQHQLQLAEFPVKNALGEIIHHEAPVRLYLDEQWQPAGYFIPWAARLSMMQTIDLIVIKIALNKLKNADAPIAINISAEALCNTVFREQALLLISTSLHKTHSLWIEFPESCALRHMAELRSFTASLRHAGCYVGLEHAGIEFTKIRELQDSGFHYLKIDSALIRNLDTNADNQIFIQGLCNIGHSLGMVMIAEGVVSEAEKEKVFKMGMDAVTGPWI